MLESKAVIRSANMKLSLKYTVGDIVDVYIAPLSTVNPTKKEAPIVEKELLITVKVDELIHGVKIIKKARKEYQEQVRKDSLSGR